MKKLITLLLVLTGMVGTASADWYVSGSSDVLNSSTSWGQQPENKMTLTSTENVYVLVVENKTVTTGTGKNFIKVTNGTDWYGADSDNGNIDINFSYAGTYTIVYYFNASTHKIRFIVTPMLRWDLGNSGNGNWDWLYEAASLFSKDGDFSWTYETPYSKFTKDTAFRIYSALWDKTAYPNGKEIELTYGGSNVNSAYFNWVNTDSNGEGYTEWCWKINKPSYDFEKVKITAIYDPFGDAEFGKWSVKADAYISKTIGTSGYSTFGSAADVDFSKAEPALTSAQKGKVESDGTITWTDATTLKGGEGALIQGTAGQTYSIPVTASASTDTEHNDFVAITETQQITQTMNGKNAYILVNGTDGLGFYKPASGTGSWCAAGTAYLNTSVSPASSRGFFPLWGDATAIESIESEAANNNRLVYDLQGRRVVNATKGLYVVNGKKVIIK